MQITLLFFISLLSIKIITFAAEMNVSLVGKFVENNNTDDIFHDVFKSDPIIIVLIVFSTLNVIFIIFPLTLAFICYDYFGPHSERVILTRLISSMCETAIGYLLFVQLIDTSRYIFGPFSGEIVKNLYFLKVWSKK